MPEPAEVIQVKERNVSNLTKALAVVSLLAPAAGLPLSIGDIELHSTLNQTLNAEIRLQVAPGENPADVSIRLAPPEKFDQAGIPWSYFLSRIKFEPVIQADGSVIIKVTSKETLTEPFLNFLLEVSWPQGSQFREFTLLIDPPTAYNQPAVPIVESSGYRAEPMAELDRAVRKSRSTARRAKSGEAASGITPQTPTSGEYGPTRESETLWGIATRLGSERGVPAKQMLTALYRANPGAFNRNDMDALKVGVTLRIPETEAILKPSQMQAQARGEEKAVRKEPASSTKPLELVAPSETKVGEKAVVGGKPGEAGGQAAAGESGKAAEGKDLELQARIDKLEQELGMMQQLLALKDQQLATLQAAGKAPAEGQPIPTPVLEQPSAPPVQQPTPQPAVTEAPQVQPTVVPVPKSVPTVQPSPVVEGEDIFSSESYYVTMGGLGAGILGVLGWLLWRRRRIDEQTNTESMFASASEIRMPDSESSLSVPAMELGSSSAYDVGTVGESSFISDFTPSDFDAFDTEQSEVDPLSEADVYLAYGRYQQAEELIRHALSAEPDRDDFKLKLLEIFYAGENKERFAAYAQELAEDGKQGDRAFWSKVTDMAKEIVSDLPLFGGTPTSVPKAPVAEDVVVDHGLIVEETAAELDIAEFGEAHDFDEFSLSVPVSDDSTALDELNAEFADLKLDFSQAAERDDHSLDFDLGSSDDRLAKRIEEKISSSEDIESIDFDLGSLSFGDVDTEKTVTDDRHDTLETFDFNFDVEEPKPPVADVKPETVLDLDLDQPSNLETYDFSNFEVAEPEIAAPSKESGTALAETGEFDFNFDFDTPVVESQTEGDEFDLSVADLTDMDEFETKIDLAKAYMDMGDADAARSIAEEVLSKGSKEQKVAAQALLDELK
jgi:pilus assembly protein FimV